MQTTWTRIVGRGLVLLALLAPMALTGCGGSDSNPTPTEPAAPTPPANDGGASQPPTTPPPTTPPPSGNPPSTQLELALAKQNAAVTDPVYAVAPTGDTRLFVVERGGRIQVVINDAVQASPFLDISGRISTDGERGLLSMAFDPQFGTNGFFYIFFTEPNGSIAIERMRTSTTNANRADPSTALRIITIAHPTNNNHNGGQLLFGPDGMLYFGTGDGGGAGDPNNNAQNLNSLLGKMLRLDVRNANSGKPYDIPSGNPFADGSGGRAEIWAYGLRNPWRFSFDVPTAQLYIADVGQNRREEINAVPTGAAGINYGWVIMEGNLCYNNASCDKSNLRLPVYDYDHGTNDENGCSIIGGMVYRGSALAGLEGSYLFSDFCSGFLKSLVVNNGTAGTPTEWQVADVGRVVSFGSDGAGEPLLITTSGLYRIVKK
jgi:glucose/arabinose dehydrogenase